jgi:transcription elongation factor SPT6
MKHQVVKRNIDHPRFHNISSKEAMMLLISADVGDFCFRPSSRGLNNLSCTWKFFENNIVHLDIVEHNKAPGANIGSRLSISDESFENLQEIVERYIIPCNRSLREVIQHQKFMKCKVLDELQKSLEQEKAEDTAKIPYKFTIVETYPQYVVLGYIPRNSMIKELIKVKARGFFFHHQYFSNLNELINWFKKEFRSPDYQRYLKKTPLP